MAEYRVNMDVWLDIHQETGEYHFRFINPITNESCNEEDLIKDLKKGRLIDLKRTD